MNSFTSFSNYGRSFTCNLCGAVNDVPDWYQSLLDVNGRPLDIEAKPELQFGSYEAVVDSKQFNMKEGSVGRRDGIGRQIPVYSFLVDVSVGAVSTGLVQATIAGLKAATQLMVEKEGPSLVGIAMVDVRTHYLCWSQGRVRQIIMADYEEAFGAIAPGRWLIRVTEETLPQIHALLDYVLSYANAGSTATHAVLYAAVKGTMNVLRSVGGGRIVVIQGSPSIGEGSSLAKEGIKVYGTTDEAAL